MTAILITSMPETEIELVDGDLLITQQDFGRDPERIVVPGPFIDRFLELLEQARGL